MLSHRPPLARPCQEGAPRGRGALRRRACQCAYVRACLREEGWRRCGALCSNPGTEQIFQVLVGRSREVTSLSPYIVYPFTHPPPPAF